MKLKSMIKKVTLICLCGTLFSISLEAKDPNVLAYIDRGIKYYPKYVKRGFTKIGKASWYGKPFHGRLTANGERYNMYSMTAAHRTYAMGTRLKITNLSNRRSVKVRVNDRGPFYSSRDIDLSFGAARKLGMIHKGVGRVKIEVLSTKKSKRLHKKSKRLVKKHASKKRSPKKHLVKTDRVKKHLAKKREVKKLNRTKSKIHLTKKIHKKPTQIKVIKRDKKIQLASFSNKKLADAFKKKHQLKNAKVVSVYINAQKKRTYRVIVNCTNWEAKKLLSSKKFTGAYTIS